MFIAVILLVKSSLNCWTSLALPVKFFVIFVFKQSAQSLPVLSLHAVSKSETCLLLVWQFTPLYPGLQLQVHLSFNQVPPGEIHLDESQMVLLVIL